MLSEGQRPVEVSIYGSVTLFDHILHVPSLECNNATVFVSPVGERAGLVRFGGCGANQAAAIASIGGAVELLGIVGEDFVRSGYAKHLEALGVTTDHLEVVPGRSSGHSYLVHDQRGGTFLIVEEGVATLDPPAAASAFSSASRYLVLNMPFDELALDLASLARQRGTKVILSGQVATAHEDIRDMLLDSATYLCCNRTEALQIGFLNVQGQRSDRYGEIECAWVTDGANGLTMYQSNGGVETVSSVPAPGFVDATGAGDAVVAGVAAALAAGMSCRVASRFGATLASFIVEAVGCQDSLPDAPAFICRFESNFGALPPWWSVPPR